MRKANMILCITILIASNSLYAQTKIEIKPDELPVPVTAELQKKYKKYDIVNAHKTEDVEHGTLYQVNVRKKNKEFNLYYGEQGELIRKSKVYTFKDYQLQENNPFDEHDGHDHKH